MDKAWATPADTSYVRYRFRTGLGTDGKPAMSEESSCRLSRLSELTLGPGESYDCRPEDVHSVIPHAWRETIVAVFQHADVSDSSLLFAREPVSFEGLYQPLERMAALEIISRARRAVNEVLPDCFGVTPAKLVGRDRL